MNLHSIVAPLIAAINPSSFITVKQSNGYTTAPDGEQIPQYTLVQIVADVQGLDAAGLRLVESLGIQGISRRVWVNGQFGGLVRATAKGGDIIEDQNGNTWKITAVPEGWDGSGWCSFVMTMQNGG